MRAVTSLALAAALLYGGNAFADNTSPSTLDDGAREAFILGLPEDLENFELHPEPRPFRDEKILDPKGKEIDLNAFDGGITVLNFWATWCPPCLEELPNLDRLSAAMEDKGVRVVIVAAGRQGRVPSDEYLEDEGFENLAHYSDPKSKLARQMGVLGLPVTAILGPDGREIGRKRGEAEWDSPQVQELLELLVKETGVEVSG